jgi:hypothetical protein
MGGVGDGALGGAGTAVAAARTASSSVWMYAMTPATAAAIFGLISVIKHSLV